MILHLLINDEGKAEGEPAQSPPAENLGPQNPSSQFFSRAAKNDPSVVNTKMSLKQIIPSNKPLQIYSYVFIKNRNE